MAATMALGECYKCLSHTCTKPWEYLRQQASIFGDRVAQLHDLNPDRYALLPKMHMFQELCSQGIQPSQGWLYREEDLGEILHQCSTPKPYGFHQPSCLLIILLPAVG